ncbi:uncharacterized protein LOC133137338 [Conger conger]|uniref:uncharacterized protein LOC133137338 n=1 Tax=Conger conger TaxID=82655 RepID=UPI002A5A5324|nr:uncharacterized protein LOC133137338 [Conger conger]XP_061111540.1 uncharacterized protein LOC133137338 [Conger conger]
MDSRLIYAVALVIGCWVLAAKGLMINSTHPVGALIAPIGRAGCGQTKTCLETPADCDPEGNGPCLFVSGSRTNGPDFTPEIAIELRGDSENYIVMIASSDKTEGGGDAAFVCAQYKNAQHFFATTFDNGSLTLNNNIMVSNVLASFNENVIRCTFTVLGLNASHYIFAGNGNFSNGLLGDPEITLRSNGSVDPISTNMPSTSENMTNSNMSSTSQNMTNSNMSSTSQNMTNSNMSSTSQNMTNSNMSSTSQNMTNSNMSSTSQNMTNSNMSSTSQNMTNSNMSSPSQNMNTIPVGALNAAISRAACGQTKLCEEVPADCDPSGNGNCLFVSATTATTTRPSGINIAFELRGNTSGYVALILSPDMNQGGGDESFVCAQFNNTLRFFTASFDNGALTMTNRTGAVSNALASLNGTVIRCTFTALGLNATASRSPDSSFYVFAGTGEYDGVSLGDPVIRLSSNGSLDLTNTTSNLPGGNGGAGLHPTSLVLLVLLSALISRLV